MIKQWHEEIEKTTRPHLNVVLFTTPAKVKQYTYLDIINAGISFNFTIFYFYYIFVFIYLLYLYYLDVVIVPYQLLINPEFFNYGNQGQFVYPEMNVHNFSRSGDRRNYFVDDTLTVSFYEFKFNFYYYYLFIALI